MTDDSHVAAGHDSSEDIEIEIAPVQVLPPVAPVARHDGVEVSPEGERSEPSQRASASRRMALRVPDDEVKRVPSSYEQQAAKPHADSAGRIPVSSGMMMPTRIISVGPPPSLNAGIAPGSVLPSVADPDKAAPPPPTLLRGSAPSYPDGGGLPAMRRPVPTLTESSPEDSWTPYQPTVADYPRAVPPVAPLPPSPVAAQPPAALDNGSLTRAASAISPVSESLSDEMIHVEPDFDSVPPSSGGSGSAFDRKSDPGEAPEIRPEDLVSVENVAAAAAVAESAAPARPKGTSFPPPPPPTQTSASPAVPAIPKQGTVPSIPPPSGPPSAVAPAIAAVASSASATVTANGTPKPPLVIVPPHVGMTPPVVDRKKPRLWWDDMFGDDMLRTMIDISDNDISKEVDFIEDSLGIAKGGALLDLGCGSGRHAIELSRRGYEVVGLDLSLGMLAQASDLAQGKGEKLNFIQGDMREMTFDAMFDGVYCWNTSFGYFEEEKNALAVGRVHKALKKGGQFLLDVINRDYVVRQAPSLAWFEGDGCVCMDEMQIDWITSRMRVKRTMMLDDGRTREVEYSIRVYSLHELGRILHEQGFRVCEVSGRITTPGVFFGNESPRTLILAEKR